MTFRARLLVSLGAVALVPLLLLGYGVRREVSDRFQALEAERLESLVRRLERDIDDESAAIAARLATLTEVLRADNRFRRATIQHTNADRSYLLDYGENAVRMTGLDMLQIQDGSGRILSSGHFRNAYDRVEAELPRFVRAAPAGVAIARARTPEGSFLALVRADSFRLGGRRFTVVGGVSVERRLLARLAPGGQLGVFVLVPDDTIGSGRMLAASDSVVWDRSLPFIDASASDVPAVGNARVVVVQAGTPLAALLRRLNIWLAAALAGAGLVALLAGGWAATRLSRPLTALATKTRELDLDRLDVDFSSDRRDEIGALSRLLEAMTGRLRDSAGRLREAERRATIGDLARQVNHDIRNGLTPIRNVFRHLAEVARDDPDRLGAVFAERRGTVESSIEYLEALATNYARLSPRLRRDECDVNAIVLEVVRDLGGAPGLVVRTELADELPAVRTDTVVLRRILENLVGNAVESLEGQPGSVTVATRVVRAGSAADSVSVAVSDTGRGMTEAEMERAFDDFYTTKEAGIGLGLSIVRRLIADLDGTLRIQTEPGVGTTFEVELPPARGGTVSHPEGGMP